MSNNYNPQIYPQTYPQIYPQTYQYYANYDPFFYNILVVFSVVRIYKVDESLLE